MGFLLKDLAIEIDRLKNYYLQIHLVSNPEQQEEIHLACLEILIFLLFSMTKDLTSSAHKITKTLSIQLYL
jgi:hypothetical protein